MDSRNLVRTCFEKHGNSDGRARRSEHWWVALFLFLANFGFGIVDRLLFGNPEVNILGALQPFGVAAAPRGPGAAAARYGPVGLVAPGRACSRPRRAGAELFLCATGNKDATEHGPPPV
jgi:hypothetical protein